MKRQFGTLCICAVGASTVLELRYTFLKRRAKAKRGLEPPRPSLFLPLFTKCVEGESSEVRPNAAREMKTARIVQGARVSVPYRRRHPRSSITGVLIEDCQNIGE
jgi:hypothetical protein